MFSDQRFQQALSEYFGEGVQYDDSHPHYDHVKLLLIAIRNIERIHTEFRSRYDDSRHWPQQQLLTRSIDDLLATFLLTGNAFYSSAFRDIRGLFETYLLLNYMNDHKIETAMVHRKQDRKLKARNPTETEMQQLTWDELYIEDEFHRMRRDEKNRLEEQHSEFKQLYNFLSNRHVHPVRFEGIDLQRTYDAQKEKELIDWQLDITLGLIFQLIKLYADVEGFQEIVNELAPIGEEIETTHTPQSFVYIAEDTFPLGKENN